MKVNSLLAMSIPLALLLLWAGTAPAQKTAEPNPPTPKLTDPKSTELKPMPEGPLAKLLAVDPKDDELRKLMKERVKASADYVRQLEPRIGTIQGEDFMTQVIAYMAASKRLGEDISELANTPEEKIAALTQEFERAKDFEKKIKARSDTGVGAPHVALGARAYRLDAEIALLKAKSAAAPATTEAPATTVWSIPQVVSEEKVGPFRRLRNRMHK